MLDEVDMVEVALQVVKALTRSHKAVVGVASLGKEIDMVLEC